VSSGMFDELIPAQPEPPSTMTDVLKSAGSGLARGTADLIGLPGTIGDAVNNGLSYVTGMQRLPQSPLSGETLRSAASTVSGGATDYRPQTTAGEFASTAGEFVPGAVALGGGTLASAIKYGVVPGLASEGAGQLTEGTGYEPYARVIAALAAPAALSAGQRLITPFPTSPERLAQASILKREGVDLSAGDITGNKSLKYAESELGGTAAANFAEKGGEQFTKAALSRAGINADRATPEVLEQGLTDIGKQFDDLASRNNLISDPQLSTDIGDTVRSYVSGTAPTNRVPAIGDLAGDIAAEASKGQISGTWYQNMSSNLAKRARGTNDPILKGAYQDLRSSLDDAMERSITANNPSDLGGWQQARKNYRNFLTLETAAAGAGEDAALGLISPAKLRQAALQTQGKRNYTQGNGDFSELARAGVATMSPVPNSGTASRLNARNLGASLSTVLGSGLGGSAGGIPGAIAGGAIGALAPAVAGRTLLSAPGRAYLSNQLLGQANIADPRYAAVIDALLSRQQLPPPNQ